MPQWKWTPSRESDFINCRDGSKRSKKSLSGLTAITIGKIIGMKNPDPRRLINMGIHVKPQRGRFYKSPYSEKGANGLRFPGIEKVTPNHKESDHDDQL